jgi:hypothetical protein
MNVEAKVEADKDQVIVNLRRELEELDLEYQ